MSNGKPFKARLGLDANNEKVVNMAAPEVGTDAVNLDYFNSYNTLQPFSAFRSYPANFLVEYSDRVWKARGAVPAGDFNQSMWTEIHAFGRWFRITGNYTAEPGDNLIVNTSSASVTITLPSAEDGDVVYIVDEGSSATNPIIVVPTSATIAGVSGNYEINSPGSTCFVYVGGTWKVNVFEKTTALAIDANFTAKPNSLNIVEASSARTVTLPVKPKDGQWVIIQGPSNASVNNVTVVSSPNLIGTTSNYTISRNFENVTFVYSASLGYWKAISNKNFGRTVETLSPLPNQQIVVALDGTTKTVNLPTSVVGDWVEVLASMSDEVSQNGAILINASAGTTFRIAGSSGATSTQYRVKKRSRILFFLRGTEWSIVHLEDGGHYVGAAPTQACAKNSVYTLNGNTILPSRDGIQVGDYVSFILGGASTVTVSDTVNEVISQASGTVDTWVANDAKQIVTYFYSGWNGTKYSWERVNSGEAYLKKTLNLSDVPDKAAARTSLDVFSKSESDARFLPLHGTADNALMAANSELLDGYDSTEFIIGKNTTTAAVDANTTSVNRFTTNVNTPNSSEMWQVVQFTDRTTSDRSQIAMGKNSNKIAYRSYTVVGNTWTSWSYLDQSATAETANKLSTPRNISLSGDASGSVNFDGSSDVSIAVSNLQAKKLKPILTPISTASGNYSKIGTYTLSSQYDGYVGILKVIGNKNSGNSTPLIGLVKSTEVFFRIYQAAAFGSNPYIILTNYGPLEFGYVIVQNNPTTIVDLYIKSSVVNAVYSIAEIEGSYNGTASSVIPTTTGAWSTLPSGYVAGTMSTQYDDTYHPLASKWETPRTITVTGSGISGSVVLDGSSDVTLPLVIDSGSVGNVDISQVNGLQDALDSKLGTAETAADSNKLGGYNSGDFVRSVAFTNSGENPDQTITPVILTNHANTPDGGLTYWYVETRFYVSRETSSNRVQTATRYNGSPKVYVRNYLSGVWGSWQEVGKEYVDDKYSELSNQTLIAIWTGI